MCTQKYITTYQFGFYRQLLGLQIYHTNSVEKENEQNESSFSFFVFSEGESPTPLQNSSGPLNADEIDKNDFLKLTKTPIIIYYGDYIPEQPSDNPGADGWRTRLEMADLTYRYKKSEPIMIRFFALLLGLEPRTL